MENNKFVCVGKDESYRVKWGRINGKPKMEFNQICFTILTPIERIDCHFASPIQAVEFAKRKIYAKGRGANASGSVKVIWYDTEDNNSEQLLATIEKNIHRRFVNLDYI